MKLNLGSGSELLDGYVNLDLYGGEVRADLRHLPIASDSVEEVRAFHVLEHIVELDRAMLEIHRILKKGGLLRAEVPYGLRSLYIPYHVHAFDEDTFRYFCGLQGATCLQGSSYFRMERQEIHHKTPFQWHLQRHAPAVWRFLRRLNASWPVKVPWSSNMLDVWLRKR